MSEKYRIEAGEWNQNFWDPIVIKRTNTYAGQEAISTVGKSIFLRKDFRSGIFRIFL